MAIIWNGDVSQTAGLLQVSGQRELRWFGFTVGQVGFGVLVSVKRQPTKRALDVACATSYHDAFIIVYGYCPVCGGKTPRQ